ncbi:MAG TPA: inorganic diphosphatase [Ferruginibacter sp.]|nr:inorganic diphosphatase [Ferruginibacter sp.]
MRSIEVIIETPKGSAVKYNYDPVNDHFKLKKALPAGMVFPFDFGFIPRTKGGDGDPLDIILIAEFGTFPGCRVECKLIGCLKAEQTGPKNKKIRNDRYLAVPTDSVIFEKVKTFTDLPSRLLKELEAFFIQYNKLENKNFAVIARAGPPASYRMIKAAQAQFCGK